MLRSYGFNKTAISHLQLVGFSFSKQETTIIEEEEEMKYTQTVHLSAGVVTDVITTIETKIYSVLIIDEDGNDITDSLLSIILESGVYVLHIFSEYELGNVEIFVLY